MKIAQHIASLLLACLMFISSTGFSMYKHYCGDNLKEISLFDEAESCHETELAKIQTDACPFHKHEELALGEEDDCCSDEYNRIALEDQVKQLDKSQANTLTFNALVKDLGYLKNTQTIQETIIKSPFTTDILINGPPLYVWHTQFNFYG